ncbi:MAG: DUF6044 family protein [Cyclobacteriaceae bacterium]
MRSDELPTLILAGGVIVLYLLPFLISGVDSAFTVHDSLDNNVVQYIILANEGKTYSLNPSGIVSSIMGGVQRMYLPVGFNFYATLFVIFKPFNAFLINFTVVHILAFVGMFLLLRRHLLKENNYLAIVAVVSVLFALTPFYSVYGLSVAGVPIVGYAFLNLKKSKHLFLSYLILGLFPLYSSLVLAGVFLIFSAALVGAYDFYKSSRFNSPYWNGAWVLAVMYALTNYQLFYQFFLSDIESHRKEFIFDSFNLEMVIENATNFFYHLHYHVSPPLGFIAMLSSIALVFAISRQHSRTSQLIILLLINVVIAVTQSIFYWDKMQTTWKYLPILKQFQWNRFYFLSPFFWFATLAVSLSILRDSFSFIKSSQLMMWITCIFCFYNVWAYNGELRETASNLLSSSKNGWTYQQFYDKRLFQEIQVFINKPVYSYRVGSIGMHPAVALANGFHTIDGYLPSYPLSYKIYFRKIIGQELNKSPLLTKYFDEWGSRCYLFVSELPHYYMLDKYSQVKVQELQLDFSSGPHVDFVFSSVEILQPELSGMSFIKAFDHDQSKWRIYLYKVSDSKKESNI